MDLEYLFLVFVIWGGCIGGVIAAPIQLEGHFVQGGLVYGKTKLGAKVMVDGQSVRVSDKGFFLVGFGRDANSQTELAVELADGTRMRKLLKIAKRDYSVQRITGLPPRKVKPIEQDMKRIHAEIAAVQKARQRDDSRTNFLSGFVWPLKGRITGVYGSQRILNGEPRRPHYGLDIAAPEGTPVRAPADGVVTLLHPDMYFSGGTLILDHGHGLSSSFLHLSKILVKKGQAIRQNEVIAEVGATGRVTGAHLDWRVNLFQARLDPQLLVTSMSAP